ncbi:MAG: ribbon-helix-helix protein, CopG family [Betaproteobacteria bacterium]|nr:ribbon-helix-helix protein, CopG family [Betaproteobacteria bacterium]
MLSVRLPEQLDAQLAAHCRAAQVSKSSVVQAALEIHLRQLAARRTPADQNDPFLQLIGSGNRQLSTEQLMRMTRGKDWNKA